MLIGLFKSNQRVLTVLIVLLTAILWIPSLFVETPKILIHEYSVFSFIDNVIDYKLINYLLSVALISIQAIYLNHIINNEKLVKNNTYLTALIFVSLNSFSPSVLVFNPIIVANCFVLMILHLMLKLYVQSGTYKSSYNISFLIAVSSLVYTPLLILFPFYWIMLSYINSPKWRDFIISIFGLLTPYFFYFTCLLFVVESDILQQLKEVTFIIFDYNLTTLLYGKHIIYFSGFILIMLLAIGHLTINISTEIVKIRKLMTMVLLLAIILTLTLLFNKLDVLVLFLLLSIPLSVLLANYLNEVKRTWISEVIFLGLLSIIAINYLS